MWSLSRWLSTSRSSRSPKARSSGTSTRWPASLSGPKRGPASYSRLCVAVRTSTALPCPTSAASTSNSPAAGRGACHSSTGSRSGRPSARSAQGSRIASSTPPATPAAAIQAGAAATETVAQGQAASQPSSSPSIRTAQAARSHSGGARLPSIASGVITSVTQGIATALAASPTSDTCWKNSSPSGASASVTTHCSRRNASRRAAGPARAAASGRAKPVVKRMPTAAKLSQKPACISAHGSAATTTAAISSHTIGQGQRRPERRSSDAAASIQTVRCEGTPQPLKTA